jgi:hypothetical protein
MPSHYRNIRRFVLFGKALALFNKKNGYDLALAEVKLLYMCAHLAEKQPIIVPTHLMELSTIMGASIERQNLYSRLNRLVELGLLARYPLKAKLRLTLTALGHNMLKELEMHARTVRVDK